MKKTNDLRTNEELVIAYVAGDDRAFTEIYNRFYKIVSRLAFLSTKNAESTKDITQAVFLKIAITLRQNKFDSSKGKFSTWMTTIIHNKLVDTAREKKSPMRNPSSSFSIHDNDYSYVVDQHGALLLQYNETFMNFHLLTEDMPLFYKKCLLQFAVEGKTYVELAEELSVSVNTIKTYIHRARKYVRENELKKELCF